MQLFVDRIAPEGAHKELVLLHGILGSGQNLRTVARRFTERAPGWAAAVVDLRGHGRSMAEPALLFAQPPTLETVAGDVLESLADEPIPVHAILGHSFGGKVALEVVRRSTSAIQHVVVVDSLPGARPDQRGSESIDAVLRALEAAPGPFAQRNDFVAALEAQGLAKSIAQWLATSSRRAEDGTFRFGIDLSYVRAVLEDYFRSDYWPVLEHPPAGVRPHLLIGKRSPVFDEASRARAAALEASAALTIDELDTGHWVHAEDPEGVVDVLSRRLSP